MRIAPRFCLLLVLLLAAAGSSARDSVPRLENVGDSTRLVVDGKPFLVRGGELGNSSSSSIAYMAPVWPQLVEMNVNTVLMPVYWELLEPEEGRFDFSLLDDMLLAAREHELRVVILWFAAWKNSMSSYVPAWVKLDEARFPRALDETGEAQEILTPFDRNNLEADKAAFVAMMRHLKEVDGDRHTVIMVQVENEIAMLPSARDYHPAATAAFESELPQGLTAALRAGDLVAEFEARWRDNGAKTAGNWESVFGESLATDEAFMAWHYARFVDEIAAAGKAVYPLPMFVNAALPRPGRDPGKGYPSAGPLPHLMDLWQAGAPAIDFLSPDFYNPDFRAWNDLYTRKGNPLFIPEHRFDATAAAKALFAFGHYEAIGFAPFSIETGAEENRELLTGAYDLVGQLTPLLAEWQGEDRIEGVLLSKDAPETILTLGSYRLTLRHDHMLGWSAEAAEDDWPLTAAIIVQVSDNSFYFAGTGVVITAAHAADEALKTGILAAEEGHFADGQWRRGRHLNGDQTHQGRHLRIPAGRFAIQRFALYDYQRSPDR